MSNMTRAERLKKYGLNRDGTVNEELQRKNADIFTRAGETLLDVGGNLLKSVVRGVEGVAEGVVGVAGAVGGLFGADTQWAEDLITQTWTEDMFSGLPESTRNSFINDLSEDGQETVRGIIDGVGQAATTVGLAFVNPALAMGYMGTSAAGRSTEESLNDGGNFAGAITYGATQGLLETALEYVTGGASRLAKIGGKQAIKSTGKLIAGEALQEAAQEGIQGAINPITKQIYKGSEALDEYNQEGFWKDVGKQALIGGVSGSMGAGMGVGIQTAAAGGRKQFQVANASAQVNEALQDTTSRFAQGKMTDEQLSRAVDDINVMNDRLEGFISKLSFEQQQEMFQPQGDKPAKFNVPQGFEWTDTGLVRTASKTTESFNDAIKQGRASVSLLGREKEVSRLLERAGTKVYEGKLASAENANYNKIRRLHQALSSKGLVRTNLVLAETMPNTEAFISDDIMVVGKDQLASEDAGVRKILHEVTHFAEGTKEYAQFASFILSQDSIKDVNARILRTAGYGIAQSDIDSALKKLKKSEELTKTEKTYVTEAVAFSAEMLLSDEATIERLCKTDRSLAQKILRKIKEFIRVINSRFNGDAQMLKELRTAEKLYVKALAKSGTEYLVKQQEVSVSKVNVESEEIVQFSAREGLEKDIISILDGKWGNDELKLTNNSPNILLAQGAKNLPLAMNPSHVRENILTEDEARKKGLRVDGAINYHGLGVDLFIDVIDGLDDVTEAYRGTKNADNYARRENYFLLISKHTDKEGNIINVPIFINEKGLFNSVFVDTNKIATVFGRKELNAYIAREIKKGNLVRIKKRSHQSSESSSPIEEHYGEIASTNNILNSNKKVNSEQKNSLKDSAGNTLTQEQAEFFKDSKVRDENGNLLVVYHGSKANETVFKKEYISSWNMFGKGYYFTSSEKRAQRYAKQSLKKVYLNIQTPFYANERDYLDKLYDELNITQKKIDDYSEKNGVGGRDFFKLCYYLDDQGIDVSSIIQSMGYDGVYYEGYEDIEVIAYESNQIKLTTNKNPTSSSDIRYSLKGENSFKKALSELGEYTEERKRHIESRENDKIARDYNEIKSFIESATKYNPVKRLHIGITNDRTADLVFDRTGVNIRGFDIVLSSNMIAHIFENHSKAEKEILRGQKPVTIASIENILETVLLPDDVSDVSEGGITTLQFEKQLEGRNIALTMISTKKSSLMLKTAWIIKNSGGRTPSANIQALAPTSKTNGRSSTIVEQVRSRKEKSNSVSNNSISKENKKSNSESQFSLKENTKYELSKGQVTKLKANYTREKAYTRKEAEAIVNTVLADHLDFGEEFGTIANKNKEEVIDILWQGLNGAGGSQGKVADKVAEYILEHAVMQNIYDDVDNDIHVETIEVLKPYLHSINLDNLKGEISYKGNNSIYAMWGKRKGETGYGIDQIAQELEEQGFVIKATADADILFEIDKAYRNAVSELKNKTKEVLKNSFSEDELRQLKNDIKRDVMIGFDEKGSKSKLSKMIEEYRQKAYSWKSKYYDERHRNTWTNRLLYKVQKARDLKLGTYKNATQFNGNVFDTTIGKLANIKYAGALNESGTRDIIKELCSWYDKNKGLFEGQFDANVSMMMDEVANGNGQLTADELNMLCNVVDYFNHFVTNFNKVYRNGKYVDALPLAEEYVNKMKKNESANVGWLKKFSNRYIEYFGDPMTVARRMDKYEKGFYTDSMESLRTAAMNAQIDEMEIRAEIDAFLDKNKKYLEDADKKTVKYLGVDIPLKEAMSLYMTLEREQAILGLAESGIKIGTGEQASHIDGFGLDTDESLYKSRAAELREEIEKQFSQADKQYIDISRKIFNEICREKKKSTDEALRGYSNVANDVYFPIRRATIAKGVDAESLAYEIDRVSNASFNKDVVKGAKQELFIEPIDKVVDRHIRAIAQYANMAAAINEYDILFNIDTGDNKNKPTSVKTTSERIWPKGSEYFNKLVSDMQGVLATKSDGATWDANKVIGKVRGAYAKYQLGANPKVWLTQLSSFFAATNILDVGSIVKGFSIDTKDVDEYCPLAKLRNYDNSAAMAQAVFDKNSKMQNASNKMDRFTDLLMKPIGKMDRFVIKRLFGACQIEVEKKNKLKVGTVENKQKAGELLTKLILETQQNSLATERSVAMRSGHEVAKTLTMFSSDAMKGIGRFFDAIGEFATLKAKRKATTDQTEIEKIDARLNKVGKQVVKSTSALISSAVFMALIAQGFRWLYNKDDEDEDIMQNMMVDAAGNMLGGLPVVRDIYSKAFEGYDIQGYSYSAINGIVESAVAIPEAAGNLFSGDSREFAKAFKELVNASGMLTGVPTRNIYNVGYGLTKRISPATAYKIDDAFYNQGYRADLAKALENEDEAMIATIAGLMLNENIGGITDSSARKNIDDLVKKGFDVLPKSVSTQITYNDETVELSASQQKRFKEVYNVANESLASLVKLSQYSKATDEVKAQAIRFIFDTYHNLAKQDVLGVELETKNVLFAEAIDIEKLAIIVATANQMTADTKNGKVVSGSKKLKVQQYVNSLSLTAAQKYMIMGYLGYKNANGEAQVKSYINRLNLTASEKEKLLGYSGY